MYVECVNFAGDFYSRRMVVVVLEGMGMSASPILVVNSGSSSLKLGLFASRVGARWFCWMEQAGGIGRQDGDLTFKDAEW